MTKNKAQVKNNEKNIKVTVHIPENVPECIKREKINFLYDMLKPKKKVL